MALGATLAVAAMSAVVSVRAEVAPGTSAYVAQADKIEAGKKVYGTQKCAQCHAIAGTGGKMASSLDGVGSKLTAAEIKQWIVDPDPLTAKIKPAPKVKMKKYVLPEADLDALIAYMASLLKK
jgi:mono/diheme cytochrome c family protein